MIKRELMVRKIIITLGVCFGIYVVIASIGISCFYYIQNNPTDKAAKTYIWLSEEINDQIGDVKYISRTIYDPAKRARKTDYEKIVPYTVLTQEETEYVVYITLIKENKSWHVSGFEITPR